MRRKKLMALFLAASLVLSGNTVSFGAEVKGIEDEYVKEDGSFDVVRWDMDHLVEKDDTASVFKDADNTKFEKFENGVLYVGGTGTFGENLKSDDMWEFIDYENEALKKISFGTGITHIQGKFLNMDSNDYGTKEDYPNLKEIEFQQGHKLDEIGRSAFKMCSGPQILNVMPGEKSNKEQGFEISHYAFMSCNNLSNVTLNNVWHLGNRCFAKDTKITSLDLGYLHHMRGDALEGCTGLSEIRFDSDNPYFETGEDGFVYKKYCPYYVEQQGLYNIEVPALMYGTYTKVGEELKPRKGTKTIAYGALASNKNIKTAKLITGVKQVQARAFYNCTNMEKLYISKSVKHIGNEAFSKLTTDTNVLDRIEDATPDDYEKHPYQTKTDEDGDKEPDERIQTGNVKEIFYSGSEEDWKAIIYDKYDDSMKKATESGKVADNLAEVGLSSNVIIHYNYFDEDLVAPDAVKKGGKISTSCCAILAKSSKIGFDTSFLGFTPTDYTIKPIGGAPENGLKINKKKWLLKAKNVSGTYDLTLSAGSSSMTIRIYVEKPVMKKLTIKDASEEISITKMLTGLTYLEPEKYESRKPSVAEISETGIIKVKGNGSTKITVTVCGKKFKANLKVKAK